MLEEQNTSFNVRFLGGFFLEFDGKPIRIIILKARQMGFSTETEAIIFKNVVTHHNYNARYCCS